MRRLVGKFVEPLTAARRARTSQYAASAHHRDSDVSILIEAAVESLDDALAAVAGGAHRLELCADLHVGGTTPAPALITAVRERVDVPVLVMIRPRAGDFVYSPAAFRLMVDEIDVARELGAAGVVLGVLDTSRAIDVRATRELAASARDLPITFHRAIDESPDLLASIDTLASLGIARVLSSGGAATALEGADTLRAMVQRAGRSVSIVAGGSVRAGNVAELVRRTGVREVHARCGGDAERIAAIARALSQLE